MPTGCYVNLVTPFTDCNNLDLGGLLRNLEFVISQGVSGVLLVGVAGESSTLSEEEHILVLSKGKEYVGKTDVSILAGTGSNSLREAQHYTKKAQEFGYEGVVVITPYYNNPPSLCIYKYYFLPLAKEFKRLKIFPYLETNRTGTTLSPEDMRALDVSTGNLCGIVWAEEDTEELVEVRAKARPDFEIFITREELIPDVMGNRVVNARGIFSILANIFPGAVQELASSTKLGDSNSVKEIKKALLPFYKIIEVTQERVVNSGKIITDTFPAPITTKTIMAVLGMPSGVCRSPLGKMTEESLLQVKEVLQEAVEKHYFLFEPIERYYGVDVRERVNSPDVWKDQTSDVL